MTLKCDRDHKPLDGPTRYAYLVLPILSVSYDYHLVRGHGDGLLSWEASLLLSEVRQSLRNFPTRGARLVVIAIGPAFLLLPNVRSERSRRSGIRLIGLCQGSRLFLVVATECG